MASHLILGALLASRVLAQAATTVVAPLPSPTGPHLVGTSVAYLVDRSRADADLPAGRPITVQLWYPATRNQNAPSRYLVEEGLSALLQRVQHYGIDRGTADAWAHLRTHSLVDAAPLKGKHPLLAFSVGLGVIRANYTSIAEELVSYGYVLAMVESPFQGIKVLPDGSEILDSAGKYDEPTAHRIGVAEWSKDITFVLDQLQHHKVSRLMTADREGCRLVQARRRETFVRWIGRGGGVRKRRARSRLRQLGRWDRKSRTAAARGLCGDWYYQANAFSSESAALRRRRLRSPWLHTGTVGETRGAWPPCIRSARWAIRRTVVGCIRGGDWTLQLHGCALHFADNALPVRWQDHQPREDSDVTKDPQVVPR